MKFEEACLLVEKYENVKNRADMSTRVSEATNALDKDIEKVREAVENKKIIKLTWGDLSSKHFEEFMRNFL